MKMNILVLYGTLEGQTAKIAERIAVIIRNRGQQVDIWSADKLPDIFSVDNYDAAIIGGPIHMGRYPESVKNFVTSHAGWLNSVPSAFFTVCMAVNSQHEKSRTEAVRYGDKLIAQSGWHPVLIETFAGAVKYTQYNLITRFIMKWISRREGGSTDTSRDHEYTDWGSVDRFAENFSEMHGSIGG